METRGEESWGLYPGFSRLSHDLEQGQEFGDITLWKQWE